MVRSIRQRKQQVVIQIIISSTMLCINKEVGLASRWRGLLGLQVMHLYLTIVNTHNNLTIDKWAAGLIDGGGRTVSEMKYQTRDFISALEFRMKSLFLSFMDGLR